MEAHANAAAAAQRTSSQAVAAVTAAAKAVFVGKWAKIFDSPLSPSVGRESSPFLKLMNCPAERRE